MHIEKYPRITPKVYGYQGAKKKHCAEIFGLIYVTKTNLDITRAIY